MTEIEKFDKLRNSIVTSINEAKLPLSTVYFVLHDIEREISQMLSADAPKEEEPVNDN